MLKKPSLFIALFLLCHLAPKAKALGPEFPFMDAYYYAAQEAHQWKAEFDVLDAIYRHNTYRTKAEVFEKTFERFITREGYHGWTVEIGVRVIRNRHKPAPIPAHDQSGLHVKQLRMIRREHGKKPIIWHGPEDFIPEAHQSSVDTPVALYGAARSSNEVWLSFRGPSTAAAYLLARVDPSGGVSYFWSTSIYARDTAVPESTWFQYYVSSVTKEGEYSEWSSAATIFTPAGRHRSTNYYRYYSPVATDTYYTTNWANLDVYTYYYWWSECQVFRTSEYGTTPFYEAANGFIGDHFYTASRPEQTFAINNYGYYDLGISAYIFPVHYSGTDPLYRYWNGRNGDHLYTTTYGDYRSAGYEYGGIDGYVYKYPGSD